MTTLAALGMSAIALLVLALFALLFSSYIKIVTVLSVVRAGFGVHSLPSAFVTGGLALALSFFVMYPTLVDSTKRIDAVLSSGVAASDLDRARAIEAGLVPWKAFMKKHVDAEDQQKFLAAAKRIDGAEATDVSQPAADSWRVLAPAFLVSELKEGFATGLSLFLPFLVIDLVVAAALVAIGITRVNPIIVALPFKLLLFVMLDGWALISTNIVSSYGV